MKTIAHIKIIFSTTVLALILNYYNISSGIVGSYYAHSGGNKNNWLNFFTRLENNFEALVTAGRSTGINLATSNMSDRSLPNAGWNKTKASALFANKYIKHHLVCNLVIGGLPHPPVGQLFFEKIMKTV